MNYEQEYKKALERAKSFQEKYGGDYAGYIFPELAESEDERIRKFLVDYFVSYKIDNVTTKLNGVRIDDILNYLEKQKEPHYTKRNALFDKCVENCDPKTVEEVNKRVDDIMNMPELSAFEQALTNFIGYWEDDEERWPSKFVKKHGKHILDMAKEELQKEQKPINFVEELKHYLATTPREQLEKEWKEIESFGSFGPTVREYLYGEQKPNYCHYGGDPSVERCKYCSATCSARLTEEQKPAEKQDYSGLNDLERAIHRGFLSAGVENVPVTIIKETAQECLAQMKPAEWSEADEEKLKAICTYLRDYSRLVKLGDKLRFNEYCDFLESLRPQGSKDSLQPHWKPSEEQMEALQRAIDACESEWAYQDDELRSLLNDLKKL